MSLSELRKEYSLKSLGKKDVNPDPIQQFSSWFEEAKSSISGEPNAMILSTVNTNNRPSSRVVLLKDFNSEGFVFFSNYKSRKGKELCENPFASILFFWGELERQIRIEGSVKKLGEKDSSEYFAVRPRKSQIGALASIQSSVLNCRTELEAKFNQIEQDFEGKEIPRPEHWGGYVVIPEYFEFWQGRQSRLHDRISYSKVQETWAISRLSP